MEPLSYSILLWVAGLEHSIFNGIGIRKFREICISIELSRYNHRLSTISGFCSIEFSRQDIYSLTHLMSSIRNYLAIDGNYFPM